MKFSNKPAAVIDELVPFSEHPKAAACNARYAYFRRHFELTKLAIDTAEIAALPQSSREGPRAQDRRARNAREAARLAELPPVQRPELASDADETVAKAYEAIDGLARPKEWNAGSPLPELSQALEVIDAAMYADGQAVTQLRSDLSADANRALEAEHWRRVLVRYRCAQELARAFAAEQELQMSLPPLGFDVHVSILPSPLAGSAILLGSESDPNSEIAQLRKFLERVGVLK
jgi:hypothetical protein